MEKIIEIKDLYINFGSLQVLKGVSLDVHTGEVIAIIGSSGSGKSTLLRCINMLEKPSKGEIYYKGVNILDKSVNIDKIRQSIGMVFQSFNLFESSLSLGSKASLRIVFISGITLNDLDN